MSARLQTNQTTQTELEPFVVWKLPRPGPIDNFKSLTAQNGRVRINLRSVKFGTFMGIAAIEFLRLMACIEADILTPSSL